MKTTFNLKLVQNKAGIVPIEPAFQTGLPDHNSNIFSVVLTGYQGSQRDPY